MAAPYKYLVKVIEKNESDALEQSLNAFLDTVFSDNLIDIKYETVQTTMGTAFTAMVIYKVFPKHEYGQKA